MKKPKERRKEKTQGRSTKTKTVVFGLLSKGIVTTEIIPNTKGKTLTTVIKNMVKECSIVISDGWVVFQVYMGFTITRRFLITMVNLLKITIIQIVLRNFGVY